MANVRIPAGVLECFFGPPWPDTQRLSFAPFLKDAGFDFYLYAPKADAHLRKNWAGEWEPSFDTKLRTLSRTFREHGLKFGICLSPYGTQENFGAREKEALKSKVERLEKAGLDYFGLFFDDMPSSEGLAQRQLEVLDSVLAETSAKVLFCPSYYSYDPILDKVFGQRPPGYVEEIGSHVPEQVGIFWTGPKVLSDEITEEHLREVSGLLKRKPFLCDNFFANDGPKNCKFLKLKHLSGREPGALGASEGWAFNPMNQPELSKLVLLSAGLVLSGRMGPEEAFSAAVSRLCPGSGGDFLLEQRETLLKAGLDQIPDETKNSWVQVLLDTGHPLTLETARWLQGEYNVGSECLTD